MPSQKVKGVSSNGIIIVFIARIDDLIGRWLMNYVRVHAGGITLGTGGVQESQVSILWNCGLWAHHVVKSSLSDMSATTSIPRARDEENHFPAR